MRWNAAASPEPAACRDVAVKTTVVKQTWHARSAGNGIRTETGGEQNVYMVSEPGGEYGGGGMQQLFGRVLSQRRVLQE
jgi:hypothetical protein